MNKRMEELQKVEEARHLVDMLDYVFGGQAPAGPVPWKGMKITLEHIGRRLVELEQLLRDEAAPGAGSLPAASESASSAGLASRIQMAPRPGRRGYSREISSGESIGAQESVRAE